MPLRFSPARGAGAVALSALTRGPTGATGSSAPGLIGAGGRLTLATGTPVMTTSQTGKTTVYWTPYNGQSLPIYDGSSMTLTDVGGELSQATTDATKSPAAVAVSSNYDMFVWTDSGTYRCTRGPAWSSDTARGTGAGTTELIRVKGILLNANAITNGPSTQRGTYVGTIRSDAASQINFTYGANGAPPTAAIFGVWNMYNRVDVTTSLQDTTASWTYSAFVYRVPRGDTTTFRVSFVSGLAEDTFYASYGGTMAGPADSSNAPGIGVGYDSTSALAGGNAAAGNQAPAAVWASARAEYDKADIGFHFTVPLEVTTAVGTNPSTFYGNVVFLVSVFSFRMKM